MTLQFPILRPIHLNLGVSIFVVLFCWMAAHADTIKFEIAQTARIEAGYQTNENGVNYGGNPNVRGNSPYHLQKGYIRFDISSLPENAIVTEATLSVWSNTSSATEVNLFAIEDGVPNENFQSSSITWDNAPGNVDYNESSGSGSFVVNNIGMKPVEAVSLGTLGVATPSSIQGNRDVYNVSLSQMALDVINEDANGVLTFALTPDNGMGLRSFFGDNNVETGLKLTYTVDTGGLPDFLNGVVSEAISVNAGTTINAINNTDLANMQAAGVKYVRIRAAWTDVEKTMGTYDWSGLDASVAKLNAYNLKPILILAYTASGYNTDGITMNEAAERQGFANYAAAAVIRYNSPSVIWEIWNEPNTDNFWSGHSADDYMGLINTAVPAMKAADPSCFVVGGSVLDMVWSQTKTWLDRCFELGFADQCDGLSVHPYSSPAKSAHPERIADEIVELRNQMASWGIPNSYPILNTEYGATYNSYQGTTQQQQEEQGAVAVRMTLLNSYVGIYLSTWYEWQPSGGNPYYALTNTDDSTRPGYTALDVMADELEGYYVEGRLGGYRANDVVLLLSNGSNRKLAVWTGDTSTTLSVPLDATSGMFSTVDTFGSTGSVSASGGAMNVSASAFPVYIDLGGASVAPTNSLLSLDVPSSSIQGSVSETNGTYTIEGAGTGIRFAVDRFHFGYETLEGDGEVIARVNSLSSGGAGVMMRSKLESNSIQATTLIRANGNGEFVSRLATQAQAVIVSDSSEDYQWISLSRTGDTFTSRVSVDGVNWVQLGSQEIEMGETVYIGLVISSYSSSTLATATIDQYEILTASTTPPTLYSGDIGNVGFAGSVSENNGSYNINASGADIWNNSDAFHFVYREMTGDGELIARVQSIENTNAWAKAGVMMRDTLAPDSMHATALTSFAGGCRFQRRAATGASTSSTGSGSSAPAWVRLVRAGDSFTGYSSDDGVNWTEMGSETITMGATIQVGIAVTSHNNSAVTEAVVDSFVIND